MRFLYIAALLVAAAFATPASASVSVNINLSAQRMSVSVDGKPRYNWAISSARSGYVTPNGVYRPQRLEPNWYSRKYGGAMPHAVFFRGGYAIHGTTAIGALGQPASHGCIRLHPSNAATLFSLVRQSRGGTRIVITGSRPGMAYASRKAKRMNVAQAQRNQRVAARRAAARNAAYRESGGYARSNRVPASALGYAPVRQPGVLENLFSRQAPQR